MGVSRLEGERRRTPGVISPLSGGSLRRLHIRSAERIARFWTAPGMLPSHNPASSAKCSHNPPRMESSLLRGEDHPEENGAWGQPAPRIFETLQ